jgi:hypothetical protein
MEDTALRWDRTVGLSLSEVLLLDNESAYHGDPVQNHLTIDLSLVRFLVGWKGSIVYCAAD